MWTLVPCVRAAPVCTGLPPAPQLTNANKWTCTSAPAGGTCSSERLVWMWGLLSRNAAGLWAWRTQPLTCHASHAVLLSLPPRIA